MFDLESGKMTGANTTLYMDETLLNEISFVQEGSFVETGGNPALKVVGQVQTVVGAQRVIVEQDINTAINADEIIKSFIEQDRINNPMEFVKQLCYQTTGNMPVYYFLSLANKTNDDALGFLAEIKFCRIAVTNTVSSRKKQSYAQAFAAENVIIPTTVDDLKYCLIAIKGLPKGVVTAHKNYILNAFYEIYTNYFKNEQFSSIKAEFRYALCWMDEALYMER